MNSRSLILDRLRATWADLHWRHHGTGMLQAYLPEGARVHVWHPSLLIPGMAISGAMHDHRFSFGSTVLYGSILHTRLNVQEDARGAHQLYYCPLEGAAGVERGLEPGPRVFMQMQNDEVLWADTTYCVNKGEFHWARPAEGLAVTFVDIINKDTSIRSRIVAPRGAEPAHAFAHQPHKALMRQLVFDATEALAIGLRNCLAKPLGT